MDHSLGDGVGRLAGQEVARPVDESALGTGREAGRAWQRALGEMDGVSGSMKNEGRHADRRTGDEELLERLVPRVTEDTAVSVAVLLNDNVDEVRVVEQGSCRSKSPVIEVPLGRPGLPEEAADLATILGQAANAARRVEVPLVPTVTLPCGRQ